MLPRHQRLVREVRYVPLHTITYRYIPLYTVTYRYMPPRHQRRATRHAASRSITCHSPAHTHTHHVTLPPCHTQVGLLPLLLALIREAIPNSEAAFGGSWYNRLLSGGGFNLLASPEIAPPEPMAAGLSDTWAALLV